MHSIVENAMKYSEEERQKRENTELELGLEEFGQPRIVIVGCGGAGNNTINRLSHVGVEGADTIAVNTDKQHLDVISADKKILVGKS
ncbi:MAG: cell division protein FtsZ, partial [Halobacteriota archaeon]|nr:cell division protein FtsZ [Halobacteriota archaeon]